MKAVALRDARAGAVVQTDFQCIGERRVCAYGVAAQFSFRGGKRLWELGTFCMARVD